MPLFVCDQCESIDNTALTNYWTRGINWETGERQQVPALCSACDPDIGAWHGEFPREKWDGKREVINREMRASKKGCEAK